MGRSDIFIGKTGNDLLRYARQRKNLTGKIIPSGLALTRQVERSHKLRPNDDFPESPHHGKSTCWVPMLIINNFQDIPAAVGQFQHGMHEAWTAGAIKP